MGFSDRDYYGERPRGIGIRTAVSILIAVNLAIWLIQVITIRSPFLEKLFACNPDDVFGKGYVWQIFTANFLHDPRNIWHILGNMLFLFIFGRELEATYGRRDFLIFYSLAGSLAILAEAAVAYSLGQPAMILGASGAVMGVVVLFTLIYPRREILFWAMFPVQVWILCIIYVLLDLSGAIGGDRGVAHWAHLAGGAVGLLYRYVDLRWDSVRGRASRLLGSIGWKLRIRRGPRLVGATKVRMPRVRRTEVDEAPAGRDEISERIDGLLDKISRSGRESLTPEEMEYLQVNSKRYKSGN
jgi:membrane associated rhomboid family serine protease